MWLLGKEIGFANSIQKFKLINYSASYPVPSYNWTRKDGGLPRHAYQINYNRVLIIPNATLNDNGEYVCTSEETQPEYFIETFT